MDQQEVINAIALSRLNYFSLTGLLQLYRTLGSATAVMEHRHDIRDVLPDATDRLVTALQNTDEALKRAEVELEYDMKYGITTSCGSLISWALAIARSMGKRLSPVSSGN